MNLFKSKGLILLGLIFLLALVLRLYNLGNVPVGFHEDEAQIAYNAYSISETGKDKNGKFLPLAIDQFGDFRPAGYHYLAIPSIIAFDLTEFAVRLPAALIGSLIVLVAYSLSKLLIRSERTALLSALLFAIVPWHVAASRGTSESIVAMLFVLLGIIYFLHFVRKRNPKVLLVAAILLSMSFFFYHSARFFVPLLTIFATGLLFVLEKVNRQDRFLLLAFNVGLLFVLSFFLLVGDAAKRPATVSIFSTPETQLVLDEQIREDGGQNPIFTRMSHNKVVNYTYTFTANYFSHFSGDFLFIKGGLPSRYIVPYNGLIYPILAPFLILGIATLLIDSVRRKKYFPSLILIWILLGPVPSALTWEDLPNFQRSIMTLPPLIIAIAYGIVRSVDFIRQKRLKKAFAIVLGALLLYNFAFFTHSYLHHTFTHRPWERSVGQKELVDVLKDYVGTDTKIILTKVHANQPIFFLYYLKFPPTEYQKDPLIIKDGTIKFKNLTFVEEDCPLLEEPYDSEAIYVNRGECEVPFFAKEIKEIKRTDGTPAFKVLDPVKPL